MPKHQPFVIPSGVRFLIAETGISIEHAGDVILHGALPRKVETIRSTEGSIVLRGDMEVQTLDAPQGTVRMEGAIKANRVTGNVVEIVGTAFQAKAVRATHQVVVGPTRITADVLIAPRIDINPKASGRIPVVDCHNDLGATAIKGCFSIKEYEELIGNASSFLAERGVTALEEGGEAAAAEEEDPEEERSGAVIEAQGLDDAPAQEPAEEPVEDPDTYPGPSVAPPAGKGFQVTLEVPESFEPELELPTPILSESVGTVVEPDEMAVTPIESEPIEVAAEPVPDEEPEPVSGPATVRVDRPEPLEVVAMPEEDLVVLADDPTYTSLMDTLRSLSECYDGGDEPPVLGDLRKMVEQRDYEGVRVRLPHIWNELVKYHREKGLRIRRQVTTTFNSIMNLVKNAPPSA